MTRKRRRTTPEKAPGTAPAPAGDTNDPQLDRVGGDGGEAPQAGTGYAVERLDADRPQLAAPPATGRRLSNAEAFEYALEALKAGYTLRELCRLNPITMPAEGTIRSWIGLDADRFARYAQARDLGVDCMAEQMLEVASDGRMDWIEVKRGGGWVRVVDNEAVMRSRLRVDTMKFYISKIAPKRYSDRIDVTSGGEPLERQAVKFGDVVVYF